MYIYIWPARQKGKQGTCKQAKGQASNKQAGQPNKSITRKRAARPARQQSNR